MARHRRFRLPGYPFHVTQRGHNRAPCFLDDSCRLVYEGLLARVSRDKGCAIHGYALMSNHVHLLVTGAEADSISAMMKAVNERYGQFFNKRFGRAGPVWQSRHWGNVVDSTEYLLTCLRYVESNPVRAGMVDDAAHYPWSSFRFSAHGAQLPLVTPHPAYLALGETALARCEAYRSLFDLGVDPEMANRIRACLRSGLALGREAFCRDMEVRFGLPAHPRKSGPRPRQGPHSMHAPSTG